MRTAWRLFSRHSSLAATAVLTTAFALGLSAALAAVADAILFRPLPVPHPDRIARLFSSSSAQPAGLVSYPDFDDFRRAARTLSGIVAQSQVLLATGDAPAEIRMGLAVTPDYFNLLDVPIAPGRGFRPEESRDAVVVLAYSYWQSHFAGDRRAIGQSILLCGTPFTILGIAPENFGLDRFSHEDFYFPIGVYAAGLLPVSGRPLADRSRRYLSVYARLAPHRTLDRSRAELNAIALQLETRYPETDRGRRALLLTEFQSRTFTDRTMLALATLLDALAVLILLIAGANLAALLLARSEARAKEVALRIAVGATPARIFGESILEAAALTLAAAVLAVPLAWAARSMLARAFTLPTDLPFSIAPHLDPRLLLVLAASIAAIAFFSALAPVRRKMDIAITLKTEAAPARGRFRRALAAAEIALATMLIVSAAVLLHNIAAAEHIAPGYRTDHVLVLALDPAQVRYSEPRARAFFDQVLARVRALRGVRSAELAQSVPLGYTRAQRQVVLGGESLTLWMNLVGPRYFELMHLPIVEGRAFDDRDAPLGAPVAIVNQELARRCGVGCAFHMGGREVRVIGVARTARYFHLNEPPGPYLYLPFSQNYASRMILHVETTCDPASLAHAVAAEIHRIDATEPLSEIRPLSAYLNQGAMFQARIAVRVLGAVGAGAIVLALASLYAVVAHTARRRRREVAVRIALGAQPGAVISLLALDAARILATGIILGVGGAIASMKILAELVPKTEADLSVFVLAVVSIVLTAAPAFFVPAQKASLMDPIRELRTE